MGGGNGYPLDSRYSWFVAAVGCLLYTVSPIPRVVGIVLVEMKPRYDLDDQTGMWIISLCPAFTLLTGPLSGYLLTRLQYRLVLIIGLFLIASGFILLAYAPTYHLLYIATICIGLGVNFNFMTCMVFTSMYFDKRRATALGLVTTGAGIGTFYLPPLCRLFFDNLSYQESFMMIAALVLQFVVLAMFVKPESYWKYNKIDHPTRSEPHAGSSDDAIKELTETESELHDEKMQLSPLISDTGTKSMVNLSPTSTERGAQLERYLSPSMADIVLASSDIDLHMMKLSTSDDTSSEAADRNKKLPLKRILLTLFTSKMFILYLMSSCLTIQVYLTLFAVLPLYAEELNIPKYHVSTAIAVYGAVEIPSRLAHGVFANQKYISVLCQLGLSVVSAALSILLLVLWPIKEMMYVCCLLLGFFSVTIVGLTPLVMLERFDKSLIPVAIGIVFGLQGMSSFIGYGVTPLIFNASGSWNLSLVFFMATLGLGGFIKIVCSFVFPVDVRFNCCRTQRCDDVTDSNS